MNASAQTQADVQAALQQWKDAYSQRDLDRALALIAPDEDVVAIGTGADEWRVGPEQVKAQMQRDFAQAEALSVAYEPLVISEAGAVAWVAGRASVQARVDGQDLALTGRFTAVLERRDGRWLLMQTHFSLPATEQAEGRSFWPAPGLRPKRPPFTLGRARAAGEPDRTGNHGQRRTAKPEVGQPDPR